MGQSIKQHTLRMSAVSVQEHNHKLQGGRDRLFGRRNLTLAARRRATELGSAVEPRWHVIVVEPIRHAESTFLCHSSNHSLISAAHNLPDEVFPDLKTQNLVGICEEAKDVPLRPGAIPPGVP